MKAGVDSGVDIIVGHGRNKFEVALLDIYQKFTKYDLRHQNQPEKQFWGV